MLASRVYIFACISALVLLTEELRLHDNSLTGAIEFGDSCPASLVLLSADCNEVECSCCTVCCDDILFDDECI